MRIEAVRKAVLTELNKEAARVACGKQWRHYTRFDRVVTVDEKAEELIMDLQGHPGHPALGWHPSSWRRVG